MNTTRLRQGGRSGRGPGRRILPLLSIGWLAVGLPRPATSQQCFNEQAQFGARATISVAWGDFNGDGRPDLAVGNNGQNNQLFVNNGDGTFAGVDQFGSGNTFAVVWADVNNDGRPDLTVGRSNMASELYLNNGDGTFTLSMPFGTHRTIGVAWADANLDGKLDLAMGDGLLGHADQNYLFLNNGDNTFTPLAQFGLGQSASVAWGDFNNDGRPDLAVGRGGFGYTGQNYLYINNGDGTFTEQPDFGQGDTSSLAWGDFNNDGWLDLAVGNWNNGQCYVYLNDTNGGFIEEPVLGVHNCNGVTVGDFNNDGWLDVMVSDGTFTGAEQSYLCLNNGDGTFTLQPIVSGGSTDSMAGADFNSDGALDIAVANEHTPAQNYLEVNCGAPGSWLGVRPVGHFQDHGPGYSNRDGIGAKIAVYEAGFLGQQGHLLGYREISAHGGFAAQDAREAHFGLPGRSVIDLRVTWPGSGGTHITQDLPGTVTNQMLTVDESPYAAAVPAVSPLKGELPKVRMQPNPSSTGATIEWQSTGRTAVTLQIFNAGGRLVRALPAVAGGVSAPNSSSMIGEFPSIGNAAYAAGAPGMEHATWDGRDERGRLVAAGAYLARPAGSAVAESGRLVIVR